MDEHCDALDAPIFDLKELGDRGDQDESNEILHDPPTPAVGVRSAFPFPAPLMRLLELRRH